MSSLSATGIARQAGRRPSQATGCTETYLTKLSTRPSISLALFLFQHDHPPPLSQDASPSSFFSFSVLALNSITDIIRSWRNLSCHVLHCFQTVSRFPPTFQTLRQTPFPSVHSTLASSITPPFFQHRPASTPHVPQSPPPLHDSTRG